MQADHNRVVQQRRNPALAWAGGILGWLLLTSIANAAAPAGQWWNTSYQFRQELNIPVVGASALQTDYSVSFTFDHAKEVSAGRSQLDGDDVRIVYWNTSAWVELDRVIDVQSAPNSSTTKVWFRTRAAVTGGTTSTDYYLYYGNSAAGTPPRAADGVDGAGGVFLLFDAFGANLNSGRWSQTTPTVSGDILTLDPGENLRSVGTFGTDTIWESRLQLRSTLPGQRFFYYWLASDSANYDGNHVGFYADNNASNTLGANDPHFIAARTNSVTRTQINEDDITDYQVFAFTRESATSSARFMIDGTLLPVISTNVPSASLPIQLSNQANGGRDQEYDWMRVRKYRNPEPALTRSAAEALPSVALNFEEASWNGTNNEVKDSSAYLLHGTSVGGANTAITSPAMPGALGTCRYGTFDGSDDWIRIADTARLDLTSQYSFAAWVRHRTTPNENWEAIVTKGDSAYRAHLNGGCTISGPNTQYGMGFGLNGGCAAADLNSNIVPAANTWYHLAGTYDGSLLKIYVNGTKIQEAAFTSAISTNNAELRVGSNAEQPGREWFGDIDEVALWPIGITQTAIQAHMAQSRACPASGPAKFVVSHDAAGIHCVAETVTVNVLSNSGTPLTTYNKQITLKTSTVAGKGTWSKISGSGAFADTTPNDGVALYTWPLGETSATFSLYYPEGTPAVNVDVFQTDDNAVRDTNTEANLTFAASGFTVTSAAYAPPAIIPAFASPQTAGTAFAVHITAFGQTPTDSLCGVIESYTGNKTLQLRSTYANPTSSTVAMTIDSAALPLNGSVASQSVTFTLGQASVSAKYKDVGSIAVTVSDAGATPVISGGTGNLIVKPASFAISVSGVPTPAPSNASGAKFVPAGAPFSVTVTARDAENSTTPSYGKETPAQSVELLPTLVAPTGPSAQNPPVTPISGMPTFNAGVSTWSFAWPEVGIITLVPHVAGGKYLNTVDVTGMTSGNVGRFHPNAFALSPNTPILQTACAPTPSTGFTYIGQQLDYNVAPRITATALAVGGATTRNYTGAFFKLSSSAVTTRSYTPIGGTFTLNTATPPNPAISDLTAGLAAAQFDVASGVNIVRGTPRAPFNAGITLSVNLTDTDGVTAAAPLLIGNAVTGMAFSSTSQQRYGRIAFRNAVGSELLPLPVPMRAEHYASDAAGFVTNTDDTCTSVTLNAGSLVGLSTTATLSNPLTGAAPGNFNLILSAPGNGNRGTVTVTPLVPAWLQFDWNTTVSGMENPSGIATFGIYQGSSRRIYQRERVR